MDAYTCDMYTSCSAFIFNKKVWMICAMNAGSTQGCSPVCRAKVPCN